jgi:hypothetical protein
MIRQEEKLNWRKINIENGTLNIFLWPQKKKFFFFILIIFPGWETGGSYQIYAYSCFIFNGNCKQ